MSNKSSIKNQKHFVDDWLKIHFFKDWPKKEDKSTKRARSTVCRKTFELSSAGRSAVVDHGKDQKHNDALKKVLHFFENLSQLNNLLLKVLMLLNLNLITRFVLRADNIVLSHHAEQILLPQRPTLFGH